MSAEPVQPQPQPQEAQDTAPQANAEPLNGQTAAPAVGGGQQVQEAFDQASEQGYFGTRVDPTPLENYTLRGVVEGKPTPETDAQAHAAAAEAQRYVRPDSKG